MSSLVHKLPWIYTRCPTTDRPTGYHHTIQTTNTGISMLMIDT